MIPANDHPSVSAPPAIAVCVRVARAIFSFATASRLFWLLLLVLHGLAIPGLVASISSGSGVSDGVGFLLRIAGLSASAAFFVLKIIDAPWLRMNGGWRSFVSIVLILILMHVGAIDRVIGVSTALDDVAPVYAYLGIVAVASAIRWRIAVNRAFCRLIVRFLPQPPSQNDPPHRRFDSGFGWTRSDDILARLSQTFLPSFSGPRAPPIS